MSGIFFTGPPSEILLAWSQQKFTLALTDSIMDEYRRVARRLARAYPGVEAGPVLDLVIRQSEFVIPVALAEPVCADPTDDKFFACALAVEGAMIISGDRHLLTRKGAHGISVMTPRVFLDGYLVQ